GQSDRAHQQSCRYTAVRFCPASLDVVFMSEAATGTEPSAKTLLRRAAGAARLDNALSTLLGLVQVAATILLALWVARTLDNAIYQPQPLLPDIVGWLRSEECRVGKECRSGRRDDQETKQEQERR